jgi:hypothetical protein
MKNRKITQDCILLSAKKVQHYNNLLISQCDSWLSEEIGLKNVEKQMARCKKLFRKKN